MHNLLIKTFGTLLLLGSWCAHAQNHDPDQQTTVDWQTDTAMTAGLRAHQPWSSPGPAGAFVGTHKDALIVAGGARRLASSDENDVVYSDQIWVATRDSDEVTWREANAKLPSGRAYGASASHPLGLIVIGGQGAAASDKEVSLLRWDSETASMSIVPLPSVPNAVINGSATVIDDTVFVLAEDGPNVRLFALDLSRIPLDDQDDFGSNGELADTNYVPNDQGRLVAVWRLLPALPIATVNDSMRRQVGLVAQTDGQGDRLFAVDGRDNDIELWALDPNADGGAPSWQQKAAPSTRFDSGTLTALGQSHILLLTGPGDDGVRQSYSYNAITNTWAAYNGAPPDNASNAGDVTTDIVRWGEQLVLVSGNPNENAPQFLNIGVNGPTLTFGGVNMTVLVVYLLSMVMVGVYFVFKNTDTNDYFRGGQSIPWWAAACSIYATMLSSLTYVALPALVYRTDWVIYIGTMMILAVAPIAIYVAMPFFRQIDATSAYEYLSKRFNMPVRMFASGLFTLFHVGRMGIVLALTALALAAVTPLDPWQSVLVMGVLSVIYCTLGGVEAVIWTDTIQTVVLIIGALLCFTIIVGGIDGGFAGFVSTGMADDKFKMVNLDFGPGSITTLSIWVIVLGGLGQNLSSYTADQAVVQRYMTTEDTNAAAKSIWMNGLMAVPGALLFFCIGTGLYAFYKSQPEKLDPTIQIDQIFPTFIGAELPVGIAGLIVAGIFAAAQSTVSTSMNSIATTIVTDFMRPFNACRSERGYLNAARVLTFSMGVLGTLAGLLFISPEIRSLMEEYFKVIGMFMGALGGLFVLGVTTRKANGWGALVGIFTGVAVMVTVWLMEWADGYLFATIGIATALIVGYLASFILPADRHDLEGLTLYTMNRDPKVGS